MNYVKDYVVYDLEKKEKGFKDEGVKEIKGKIIYVMPRLWIVHSEVRGNWIESDIEIGIEGRREWIELNRKIGIIGRLRRVEWYENKWINE